MWLRRLHVGRGQPSIVQGGSHQDAANSRLPQAEDVFDASNSPAADESERRKSGQNLATQVVGSATARRPHIGQIQHDQLADSNLNGLADNFQRVSVPPVGVTRQQRSAILQVQAERDFALIRRHDASQRLRIGAGFQADNRSATRLTHCQGLTDAIDSRIDQQGEAIGDQLPVNIPIGLVMQDGIEIGDIKLVKVECIAQRAGDIQCLDALSQPADQRAVFRALARDPADDDSIQEIQDWPDLHGRVVVSPG